MPVFEGKPLSPAPASSASEAAKSPGVARVLFAVVVLVVAGVALLAYFGREESLLPGPPQPPELPESPVQSAEDVLATGLDLYERNCAACHGIKGFGDGTAAYLLHPKPRDFSSGKFRLTSVSGGLPSDADLLKTLRNGMPGSVMPSWEHLTEADLNALVQAVRHLALEGKVVRLTDDGDLSRQEAMEIAHEMLDTGPPVELPPKPEKIDVAIGKRMYLEKCASCHDEDGRGRLKQDLEDEDGNPIFARDFTQGIFKGGADDESLAMRLTAGLPGSAMPSTEATSAEMWALVRYMQTMIKSGAQERIQQSQKTLTVKRVQEALDATPEDSVWDQVAATFLPLMPLWWRNDRIEGVDVKALHDGSRIAMHLSWEDAVQDGRSIRIEEFSDAAAVQFSRQQLPPFMGMGDKESEVNIWYWKADHASGGRPTDGIETAFPNTIVALYPFQKKTQTVGDLSGGKIAQQASTYVAGWGSGNPVSQPQRETPVDNLHARGFGTLEGAASLGLVKGLASWKSGRWRLVMIRKLQAENQRDIAFQSGQTISVGFAVWDGAAEDRDGQKSVTVWHNLVLE